MQLPPVTMIFLLHISLLFSLQNVQGIDILIKAPVGNIRGLEATDGNYTMFMGIPYATVNDSNPFGLSIPYTSFASEYYANDSSYTCPHITDLTNNIVGNLDCLRLNVYVPHNATADNLLPVMFWIYGGNFERGSATKSFYGPKFLVRHDVVLVTINHRIGVYGYMCLDIPEVAGNQGLKDQITAMRWVQQNIKSFGGDPTQVTIFGQSTGSRSVDFHLLSPQEKLFNSAMLQSGTSLTRDTIFDAETEAPQKIAKQLGYTADDVYDAIAYLATVEPKEVLEAANNISIIGKIKPCVEKDFDGVEKVITDYTVNLNYTKVNNTAILIGYNNNEQIARYANQDFEFWADLDIFTDRLKANFDFDDERLAKMSNIVRRFYIGNDVISKNKLFEVVDFDSAFSYLHPTERTMNMFLEYGANPIYYYVFSYVGGRNYYKEQRNVTIGGVSHADDLAYLWDMISMYPDTVSKEDQLIIDRMTTLWTNFAKYGKPQPEVTELLPVLWLPVTSDVRYYYNINTELNLGTTPFHNHTSFWDLFYDSNWIYQKGYKSTGVNFNKSDFYLILVAIFISVFQENSVKILK